MNLGGGCVVLMRWKAVFAEAFVLFWSGAAREVCKQTCTQKKKKICWQRSTYSFLHWRLKPVNVSQDIVLSVSHKHKNREQKKRANIGFSSKKKKKSNMLFLLMVPSSTWAKSLSHFQCSQTELPLFCSLLFSHWELCASLSPTLKCGSVYESKPKILIYPNVTDNIHV